MEGALGDVHAADWRNFGHGRHHSLAKRASGTTVVAMIGAADRGLAARTLDLLSAAAETHAVWFDGAADEQGILAMLFALHLAALAGEAAGIDPGRPGVPDFGRKLYYLWPQVPISLGASSRDDTQGAGSRSKTSGRSSTKLMKRPQYRFRKAIPCGVVFDYDGTLCDRRQRFIPLSKDIAGGLVRLAERGTAIGVATGRGRSAGACIAKNPIIEPP